MLTIDATRVLVGLLLLVFGRRLFWLFVGAVGFVAGIWFSDQFLQRQPEEVVVIFSLVVGLLAAILAVAVRKLALGAAGFLAGGYFLVKLLDASGQQAAIFAGGVSQFAPWITFLVGGLLGAVLINVLFTWTLIVLSALGGAALVCESLHAGSQVATAAFTVLAVAGVLFQSGLFRRRRQLGA